MATVVKDLGAVTAYAYAVEGGYTGTESEFEALLGNIAEDLSEIENLSVTVTTLPAGSSATASYSNGVLSLGIPKGDKGDTGATPNFSIGTVQTLLPTQDATATITGTAEAPVLNLGIPKGYSGDATNLAADYSLNKTYAVGEYCIYNGSLYRCTTAITTAETWTAAHWTAAVLGDDVSNLKSALENGGLLITQSGLVQGSYNSAGAVVSNQNRIRNTGFLSVEKGGIIHFDPGETVTSIFYGRFAADKSFIGDGPNWLSGDITVDWDGYAIVTYKNATNTALSVADYDATTVIMTAAEAAKFGKETAVSSYLSVVNPMNPMLFDLMYFRKGQTTSGTEHLTTYSAPRFVNNQFDELNSATASSGVTGYLAFRFNDNNKPGLISSGETASYFLIAKTNKSMTFIPRLSSSTTWAPNYSVALADSISLSPGYNCIKLEFAFDHSGTDGRTEYRYFVLEGNTVYSDLDAEFSLVRDDSFLGWVKEIEERTGTVYDTDLLFWGDSLTAGAGGGDTSYPKVCAETLGLNRINAGVGGETANTIAARQGGNNIIIPAGGVNGSYVTLSDVFGSTVAPLLQGNGAGSGNKLVVNGYECTLSYANSTYTVSGYTGPTLSVPAFARFAGSDFTGKVVVIFVGQNGATFTGLSGVDARIAIIDSMIKHIGHERYVVLGLTTGTDASREADDNQMLANYGNKFFPTRKLLVDYGLTINGLTPTSQDTTDIAAGTVPTSLRSDSTHMNAYGYTAIGKMLADKIRSLGYV